MSTLQNAPQTLKTLKYNELFGVRPGIFVNELRSFIVDNIIPFVIGIVQYRSPLMAGRSINLINLISFEMGKRVILSLNYKRYEILVRYP